MVSLAPCASVIVASNKLCKPKERPSRATRHQPSVQLSKRKYAVQENAVEPVAVGTATDVPVRTLKGFEVRVTQNTLNFNVGR
jgi:hypothetical protein